MRKFLVVLSAMVGVSLTAILVISFRSEPQVVAQVKSGPIPTPAPSIDPFSAEEKAIIQSVKDIAARFEASMKEKEPKWKLKKKSISRDSRGVLPQEKGGEDLFFVNSNFQFRSGSTVAWVDFSIANPSSIEEVATSFQHRLEGRARGIGKGIADIGDRAVLMMDLPGTPSTATNLYFRKGKFKVNVDITNQSRTRERNEQDAIRIGKIIDSAIF